MSTHPEVALQIAIADFLRLNENRAIWEWWHVPNGELRDKRTAAKLKAMGVKPGCPDIVIDHMGQIIYIEIKHGRGKLSQAQEEWYEYARFRSAPFFVVYSVDQMARLMDTLRIPIKARVA